MNSDAGESGFGEISFVKFGFRKWDTNSREHVLVGKMGFKLGEPGLGELGHNHNATMSILFTFFKFQCQNQQILILWIN